MEFRETRGIYFQISENIVDRILSGEWKQDERLPSIRETAVDMEVNPNTAARAYAFLQERDIIHNRRGIGYYVSPDGERKARQWKREEFIKNDLPAIFRNMRIIGLDMAEIAQLYEEYNRGGEK